MNTRIDPAKVAPDVYRAMLALDSAVKATRLDSRLLNLVKLRASQINGCAFCIDMHAKDLRADGESEERLYLLEVWRDTRAYSDRERAALEWTEAITLIADEHVSDELYEHVREHFSEDELVKLTLAIVAINGWNRFSIAFGAVPGSYHPVRRQEPALT